MKVTRRGFLSGAASVAAAIPAAGVGVGAAQGQPAQAKRAAGVLPRRKLGRNGPEVTMLATGGQSRQITPDYYDRAWDMGIRYFDMAESYRRGQTEREMAKWIERHPRRRGEVFIATKDRPRQLAAIPGMIDKRLAALKTDYLDWFLIHGISARDYGEGSYDWPKSDAFARIREDMIKAGKVRLMGFSCHDLQSDRYLHAAAEGGFVDAILMHSFPFHRKGDAADMAIQACHDAGIGLVGMKVMRNARRVPRQLPEFEEAGLTTHQAALHALWSDERFSAAVIWMDNDDQMTENCGAVRKYKGPILAEQRRALEAAVLAAGPAICPGCPACQAAAERTGVNLNAVSRYVAYYEQDGTAEARDQYRALTRRERDLSCLDLEQLKQACCHHVDYPKIAERAAYFFG
ncbi:MAG: aldo/keto reductase [Planctomycetota bacterium]